MSQSFEIRHFEGRPLRCGHRLQRPANPFNGARSVRFADKVVLDRNYRVFDIVLWTAAAQGVDRPVARGDRQPSARVGRNAVTRPALRGDRERLLGGLLSEIEIAEETDQGRENTTPLIVEGLFQDR